MSLQIIVRIFVGLTSLVLCIRGQASPQWGVITRAAVRDAFTNSSLANNFTVDADGSAGTLFTQSLVNDAVTLDSFGRGPHDRGLAQGFAALTLNARQPPILKAQAILTGNISNQPPVGGRAVNDAGARGTANASEIFQYIGAVPTVLTWSFTLEGRLVDPVDVVDPEPNAATYIKAQVAVFPESGYFFTTEVVNLFDNGVFPKNSDLTSLQILDDTAGLVATRTASLSFGVAPGEIFYLFGQLDAQAFRDTRLADAFGTLSVQFDQPELVRSLSVPEPASAVLFALAALVLVLTISRCERRCAIAYSCRVATSIVMLASAIPASAAMLSANSVAELVSAIDAANQNAEPDSITLLADAIFTLTEQGLPQIVAGENLTIVGNGATIRRSSATETPRFRLFHVADEASLALENLTLSGGSAYGGGANPQGGAISSHGDLTLRHVTVQNSRAQGALAAPPGFRGASAHGGGIYSSGSLTIENSTIQDNSAFGGNGGRYACGPPFGCRAAGDGGAGVGGGLYIAGGTATLRNSVVTHNSVQGGAGGQGPDPGTPGTGIAGGLYISINESALVYLDAFTRDHVLYNTSSGSSPNISGPFQLLPNPSPGDYNFDGSVDAADYVVWRKNFSNDQTKYNEWRANFGRTLFAGSGAAGYPLGASAEPLSAAVPEPSTLVLLLLATAGLPVIPRNREAAKNRC